MAKESKSQADQIAWVKPDRDIHCRDGTNHPPRYREKGIAFMFWGVEEDIPKYTEVCKRPDSLPMPLPRSARGAPAKAEFLPETPSSAEVVGDTMKSKAKAKAKATQS